MFQFNIAKSANRIEFRIKYSWKKKYYKNLYELDNVYDSNPCVKLRHNLVNRHQIVYEMQIKPLLTLKDIVIWHSNFHSVIHALAQNFQGPNIFPAHVCIRWSLDKLVLCCFKLQPKMWSTHTHTRTAVQLCRVLFHIDCADAKGRRL